MQEGIFNQMPMLIKVFIVIALIFAVFLGRDHRPHALALRLCKNGVAVIASISNQMIGMQPFNQAASLRAICSGTLCNKDSERHTKRIHGQMYLGIEPPFVRVIS